MELTKEYFDQKFVEFAKKSDLEQFAKKSDLDKFATKEYFDENQKLNNEYFDRKFEYFDQKFEYFDKKLESQTKELKGYMDEEIVTQIESLAAMIKRTVADPLQEHIDNLEIHEGLKVRVDHLEKTLLAK